MIYDYEDDITVNNDCAIGWKVKFDDGSLGIFYACTFKHLLKVLEIEIFHFEPDDIVEIKKGCDW